MSGTPALDPMSDSAADFESSPEAKIAGLERTLARERDFAVRSNRQLHRTILEDMRQAKRRTKRAEQQRDRARARVQDLEAEIRAIQASRTWRVGHAVVSVPRVVRNRVRKLRQR